MVCDGISRGEHINALFGEKELSNDATLLRFNKQFLVELIIKTQHILFIWSIEFPLAWISPCATPKPKLTRPSSTRKCVCVWSLGGRYRGGRRSHKHSSLALHCTSHHAAVPTCPSIAGHGSAATWRKRQRMKRIWRDGDGQGVRRHFPAGTSYQNNPASDCIGGNGSIAEMTGGPTVSYSVVEF